MAEINQEKQLSGKDQKFEREYVIPIRKAWVRVPQYRRAGKAIKAIKIFIAKHMKVPNRDVDNVRLDVYFNNNIWFRGRASPPSKVKVKATKEGDIVRVTFAEIPQAVKYIKAKNENRIKTAEKREETEAKKIEEKKGKSGEVKAEKPEEKKEETPEEKKNEKEKETSVAQLHEKEAKIQTNVQKHVTKSEKAQRPQRMALQK